MRKTLQRSKLLLLFAAVVLVIGFFLFVSSSQVFGNPTPNHQVNSSLSMTTQSDIIGSITIPSDEIQSNETFKQSEDIRPTRAATVSIYFFWGDGCPHCAAARPFLQSLVEKYPQAQLIDFEVWYVPENQEIFKKMTAAYGFEPHAVPTIFIGDQYWEGYSEVFNLQIEQGLQSCISMGCIDRGQEIITGKIYSMTPTAFPSMNANSTLQVTQGASFSTAAEEKESSKEIIRLPLFGIIDLSRQTFLVSTIIIAFVDGFNPCSIWVLTMLLALTLHTGSRKKVLLIGLIFLTVTAAIYGLFITGLFTMFKVVSFVGWIQIVVAVVALFFALVNIKDYFWYKEGFSLTISDAKKPGIFQRIRNVMNSSQSIWGLIGGTIVLAGGVSLVEFSCTAGFPVLWANLLVSQNTPALTFVLLLLIYLVIYQLDEIGIFLVAVFTMRASKLEEKHGRILKLFGGIFMLALAMVMLINPSLMNNLTSSLIVLGGAFATAFIILFVHRIILPKIGVLIGTEFRGKGIHKKRRL